MRGRKPKPTKLKILAGNPGQRPLNDREPQPRKGELRCPAWLHKYAKSKWRELAPELERLGLLTVVDGEVLACLCQAWAEFRVATELLEEEGRTCYGGSGGLKAHPAVAMQRTAWKEIRALSGLFGLDPSSRSRIKTPLPDEEADPLEAYFDGVG